MNRILLLLLSSLLAASMLAPLPVAANDGVPSLSKVLGQEEEEFLRPEDAFQLRFYATDPNVIEVTFTVAEAYYLYQKQFDFEVEGSETVSIGDAVYPEGEIHSDEFFGEQVVYRQQVSVLVPVAGNPGETFNLRVRYQGCADAGLCYPPLYHTEMLEVPAGNANDLARAQAAAADLLSGAGMTTTRQPEQDRLADLIKDGQLLWVMLTFVGLGLLLTFTPCVLPMIPILSSIIVGQEDITRHKAFILSLVYVLAMAVTYTIAGVLAGLFGANVQAAFQDPYIIGGFVAVFVLLSLSMFGFYELQVPASWQAKLAQISQSQQGGTLTGVAIMGFLSALIVGPCVTAPLTGALIAIAETGDPTRGGLALFALSIGMGIPLILIGMGFGQFVPKAGGWMESVKKVFGVMLLAIALYLLERVVPAWVTVGLAAMLVMVSAVYMGSFSEPKSGWQKLWKGLGLVLFAWGLLMVIGLATGRASFFTPLKNLTGGGSAAVQEEHLPFQRIKSIEDLDAAVAKAAKMNKPVMIDFYADWCISCKEMEAFTFTDEKVRRALGDFVLLQADVTANDEVDQALMQRFDLIGPPGIFFFDRSGEWLPQLNVIGYMDAEEFSIVVTEAGR
ncbi:MAG: protein-disulfide reductase DsbD [Gammaproteobacteria bacterium]|nr:protein-disulfide reductase DsbD [Gammaproteobacteria bacterium]